MSVTSVGDQSQFFLTRNQNTLLKTQMQQLSQELASGQLAKPATPQAGDVAHLMSLGRDLTTLASYTQVTKEADTFASVAQDALGTVSKAGTDLGASMVSAGTTGSSSTLSTAATDAKAKFAQVVNALNATAAGRSVFSGTATDQTTLADADTILASLSTAISGQTTAQGISDAVDAWFDTPGGGYDTVAYNGNGKAPVYRTADGETVTTDVTAGDQSIRDVLKGFALAALVNDPTVSADLKVRSDVAKTAGTRIITNNDTVTKIQAAIGSMQAQIETRSTQQSAQKSSLELAQSKFTAADPYDTATAYQQVSAQLQSLYVMTAKMSQMSLVEYLS